MTNNVQFPDTPINLKTNLFNIYFPGEGWGKGHQGWMLLTSRLHKNAPEMCLPMVRPQLEWKSLVQLYLKMTKQIEKQLGIYECEYNNSFDIMDADRDLYT